MTTPPGIPDENSHATELRRRWTLPENAPFLVALRSALTSGTGDWRAMVRTWTQPWATENDLGGIPLAGANLSGLDLTGVHLSYADLRGATLTGCDLTDASLTGADLREARLVGAVLTRANAVLVSARTDGTLLTGARMQGVRRGFLHP
ncbi:pentapeptide repeat-containing protein [Streptomyces sp. NBC_00341]|uniref:pentapeptide repeat-containing protein n=1 Tax=Streptomyces sp. NBC_00341 TaxID=2975717 RepID=UPI0030891BE1|nr:pentapeptide repeat-containing protein [Streptomyces sp. NBC_00341]